MSTSVFVTAVQEHRKVHGVPRLRVLKLEGCEGLRAVALRHSRLQVRVWGYNHVAYCMGGGGSCAQVLRRSVHVVQVQPQDMLVINNGLPCACPAMQLPSLPPLCLLAGDGCCGLWPAVAHRAALPST